MFTDGGGADGSTDGAWLGETIREGSGEGAGVIGTEPIGSPDNVHAPTSVETNNIPRTRTAHGCATDRPMLRPPECGAGRRLYLLWGARAVDCSRPEAGYSVSTVQLYQT